jgi:hypothetical protein
VSGAPPGAPALRIAYRFTFSDGRARDFALTLDHDTLQLLAVPRDSYPEWTALSYKKCPNCPLDEAQHPRCPVAANLVDVVETFKDERSFDDVDVAVDVQERRYVKRASVQEALSAMIGVLTVASGCPVLNKLRPMVETHLPFMSPAESTYRVIAMYLLAQYFRDKQGLAADWDLDQLVSLLEECRQTNAGLVRRLQTLGINDATLNALTVLNTMGEITSLSIEGDMKRLEKIFGDHYGRRGSG